MSVDYIEVARLARIEGLYAATLARYDLHDSMTIADVDAMALALVSVHHANVLALHLSYEDTNATLDLRARHDLDPHNVRIVWHISDDGMRELVQSIRHIKWNCISNSGTHCLPAKYEAILDRAEVVILRILARVGRFAGLD